MLGNMLLLFQMLYCWLGWLFYVYIVGQGVLVDFVIVYFDLFDIILSCDFVVVEYMVCGMLLEVYFVLQKF